jgi:hypothetical protein
MATKTVMGGSMAKNTKRIAKTARWARLRLDLEGLERAIRKLAAAVERRRARDEPGPSQWSVVEEDGYVKVRRGAETICAGVPDGPGRVRDVEFTEERHRKSNATRQRAMRALREAGWR